jgi:TM2 domain-containing membrane protein YozV
MANSVQFLPQLEGMEMTFVQGLLQPMTDNQAQLFAQAYLARRRDPQQILIVTILGFILIAGVQRIVVGHIGMGLLYLLTGGLCFIGTIIDLVNYKSLAFEYNQKIAQEVSATIRNAVP